MRPSSSFMRLAALALAAAGLVLHSPPAGGTVNLTVFTNPHQILTPPGWSAKPGTIGFCFAGDKFVGSVYTSGPDCLYECDLNGVPKPLSGVPYDIPDGALTFEHMVASSFGVAGWPLRDIYVGYGLVPPNNDGGIYRIGKIPADTGIWWHLPAIDQYPRGLLFDPVGTFGGDLLISTYEGHIYRVNHLKQIVSHWLIGRESEGMDIAPLGGGFGPSGANYDGDLFIANEFTNSVWVISPDGAVNQDLGVYIPGKPEELSFVPMDLDAASSVQGFYAADYEPDVLKGAASQFVPYRGDLIVTSEVNTGNNLYDVHWNGAAFAVTCIGSFPVGNQPEDGIFVTDSIVNPKWGPCCLPNEQCVVVSAESCMALSGAFWAGLSSCQPNPCCTGTCFNLPACLSSWYPIEEADGDAGATDVVGGASNSLSWRGAGVNWLYNGPCPSSMMTMNLTPPLRYLESTGSLPAHDVGTGSFSIFAWVKMNNASDGLLHTLVQKMVPILSPANQLGYGLDIYQGHVRLRMSSGSGYKTFTNPTLITDGVWHLVGATVCRSTETFPPFVASVYLDLNQYSTNTPADMGSLLNPANLRLGTECPGLISGQPFDGAVDQLQIYKCCLSTQQEDSLYQRSGCYCPDRAWVPSVVGVSNPSTPNIVITTLRICNYSAMPQTYSWTAYGLPAGTCGNVSGPTAFTKQSCTSVTIPGSGTSSPPYCMSISIAITLPPGIGYYDRSCYGITVKNLSSGNCIHVRGAARRAPWPVQPQPAPTGRQYSSPIVSTVPGQPVPVRFKLWNSSGTPQTIGYHLIGQSSDGDPLNQVVSLNGLPPGLPVTGLLTLAPGDSNTVEVQAVLTEFQPLNINEVLLSIDWSGGPQYEPEAVVGLSSVTQDQLTSAPESPPGYGLGAGRSELTAAPNPFLRGTEIRFRLTQAQASVRIDVFDVGGRLVRALFSGPLSAGSHEYRWDGLDDHGEARRDGIYFIRAQTGGSTLTNKVVRLQ
jgi:hypothetical protein